MGRAVIRVGEPFGREYQASSIRRPGGMKAGIRDPAERAAHRVHKKQAATGTIAPKCDVPAVRRKRRLCVVASAIAAQIDGAGLPDVAEMEMPRLLVRT